MASANLTVTKASLSAALFRPDPKPCSRDETDLFFSLLASAVTQCSPANVQKCKQWALLNLVQSSGRVAPLGKYLCALSDSFTSNKEARAKSDAAAAGTPSAKSLRPHEPSDKRKRLHILYILSDVFYHTKFRGPGEDFPARFEPFLAPLVRAAADFSNCPKHIKKIHGLVAIWEENGYFAAGVVAKLRAIADQEPPSDVAAGGGSEQPAQPASTSKSARDAPFVMPAMHGDPATPWYDLPAGTWLPVLEPNSTRPMNPSMIKPLQLAPGPTDKSLADAVKKLLVDVDNIYAWDVSAGDAPLDVDQMGEQVELDEITGEILGGETYYGWSRAFCDKMKQRRKKRGGSISGGNGPGHRGRLSQSPSRSSRSPSYDRSRSSSRGAPKRRRLSGSPEWQGGGGRNRRRSRSGSRYRASSRDSYRRRSWTNSRSATPPRSRSRGPPDARDIDRRRPSPPRHSPPRSFPGNGGDGGYHHHYNHHQPPQPNHPRAPFNQQAPPAAFSSTSFPPVPPPIGSMPPMPHPAFGAFHPPVPHPPPPPPPNYQGQWPPPPPPPPMLQQSMGGGGPPNFYQPPVPMPPQLVGGWQPAPPFPPLGHPQQQQTPPNQYPYGGRGNGGFRGMGRGGGYGRGGW